MTNREAIDVLKEEWRINAELFGTQFGDALALAIKALEEKPQGDLISREALRKDIEHLYSVYKENKEWFYADVLDHIDNTPTANELGCENCVNKNTKSRAVCTSPFGVCKFFEEEGEPITEKAAANWHTDPPTCAMSLR